MIVGLDVSARATALCFIDEKKWDAKTLAEPYVFTHVFGSSVPSDGTERERVERLSIISDAVVRTLRQRDGDLTGIFIEDYAFSSTSAHVRTVAEVTGVIKRDVFREIGMVVQPIVAAHARKILLQKLPRMKGLKGWIVKNVRRLGGQAIVWTEDEIDAFVIANAGLMKMGGVACSFLGLHDPGSSKDGLRRTS